MNFPLGLVKDFMGASAQPAAEDTDREHAAPGSERSRRCGPRHALASPAWDKRAAQPRRRTQSSTTVDTLPSARAPGSTLLPGLCEAPGAVGDKDSVPESRRSKGMTHANDQNMWTLTRPKRELQGAMGASRKQPTVRGGAGQDGFSEGMAPKSDLKG